MKHGSSAESSRVAGADEVSRAIVKIQAGVLAITCALIGGAALFLMTVWLLLKGGPQVGEHLQLLGHYFPGYTVTWTGSIIGFFYGAIAGGAIGWVVGKIYNEIVRLRQR